MSTVPADWQGGIMALKYKVSRRRRQQIFCLLCRRSAIGPFGLLLIFLIPICDKVEDALRIEGDLYRTLAFIPVILLIELAAGLYIHHRVKLRPYKRWWQLSVVRRKRPAA
jgi:hypothetical protein